MPPLYLAVGTRASCCPPIDLVASRTNIKNYDVNDTNLSSLNGLAKADQVKNQKNPVLLVRKEKRRDRKGRLVMVWYCCIVRGSLVTFQQLRPGPGQFSCPPLYLGTLYIVRGGQPWRPPGQCCRIYPNLPQLLHPADRGGLQEPCAPSRSSQPKALSSSPSY